MDSASYSASPTSTRPRRRRRRGRQPTAMSASNRTSSPRPNKRRRASMEQSSSQPATGRSAPVARNRARKLSRLALESDLDVGQDDEEEDDDVPVMRTSAPISSVQPTVNKLPASKPRKRNKWAKAPVAAAALEKTKGVIDGQMVSCVAVFYFANFPISLWADFLGIEGSQLRAKECLGMLYSLIVSCKHLLQALGTRITDFYVYQPILRELINPQQQAVIGLQLIGASEKDKLRDFLARFCIGCNQKVRVYATQAAWNINVCSQCARHLLVNVATAQREPLMVTKTQLELLRCSNSVRGLHGKAYLRYQVEQQSLRRWRSVEAREREITSRAGRRLRRQPPRHSMLQLMAGLGLMPAMLFMPAFHGELFDDLLNEDDDEYEYDGFDDPFGMIAREPDEDEDDYDVQQMLCMCGNHFMHG